MPASSPDRGRRPQVRGGSFPDPASAPEGPSGIRSSGLKPSQILHRRVFALRRTSVFFCSKNSNSANPDAKERHSQAQTFPFGCFRYFCACGAVAWEVRGSQAPPEHRPDLVQKQQSKEYMPVSRAAERPIGQPTHQSAQRGRSGARKSSRCTVRQEPASHHGINGLILCTVRRSTAVGNAVPSRGCPQLLTGSRQGVQSSHFVRVLCFRPRRPYPLLFASTANAGPELTLTVACAGAGVLDDFPRSSARAPGQARAAFSPCIRVCRSVSRRVSRDNDKMFATGSKTRLKSIDYRKYIVI